MSYLGDFALGSTLDTKFATVTTTGAPTTLAGTPVISAYVDNSLTQLTAGITLTVDFDAVTGLNNARVVATSGNGYAAGSNYQLVITAGTVGGTSVVGYVVAEFSIENRSSLRPTTAARTLDVSATGEAGLDWANIGSPTTSQTLSGTTVGTATAVTTVNGLAAGTVTAAAIADNAIDRATFAVDTGLQNIRANTAQAGTANSITLDAGASATDTFYTGTWIYLTGGTGAGQSRFCYQYTGATKVALTAPNWATNPDATSTFAVLQAAAVDIEWWRGSVPAGLTGGRVESVVGAYASGQAPLQPTVAGRTLDVTATGEGGIDWANIGGPTTAQTLSGTTVGTATALTTNNDKIGYSIASGGIGSGAHAAAELNNIADSMLDRNMATGTDSGTDSTATRTVRQALRTCRNKAATAAGTLTVYKEDDVTASFTAAITTTAGNPVTTVDPT